MTIMKRIFQFFASAVLIGVMAALAVSCQPSGGTQDEEFDAALLYAGSGEWVYTYDYGSGPEEIHLTFQTGGRGFQTTSTQPEPQNFTWSLDGARLTFIHKAETGADVPEECTVTTLTATRLAYRTETGRTVTCTKL
jgi:hypothetical protein